MRILAIDVGTGTQDILLFDSNRTVENCIKMVMPSPTMIVATAIASATKAQEDVLLIGVTMGGGPCTGATRRHIEKGNKVFATPDAARAFDDDLDEVKKMGVVLISEDEARRLSGARRIETADVDLDAIGKALESFGVDKNFDAVAVAVQDHGAGPPGVSDRVFRFEYLRRMVESDNRLAAFAYLTPRVPDFLTRMKGVATTLSSYERALVMDTGPAACLGTLEDSVVAGHENKLLINLGNAHTLANHLLGDRIVGVFEHHTGQLTVPALERYIEKLIAQTITYEEVFEDHGHGAYLAPRENGSTPWERPFIAATGPRRGSLGASSLKPYLAVPHGDMMLAGSFGLIRAFGEKVVEWREEIEAALAG